MPDTVAVILAGGEGRRMGGNKPLQHLGAERLIDIAISQVRGWNIEVAVAVRYAGQVPGIDVPEICDAEFEGPLAGLAAALRWAGSLRADYLLVVPCDTPGLPSDLPARLMAAAVAASAPSFARSMGGDHPECAIWPVTAAAQVEAFAAEGGRSLTGALERCGAIAADWSGETGDPFVNLNTQADIQRFRSGRP